MQAQPEHLKHRTIYRAHRSHSLTHTTTRTTHASSTPPVGDGAAGSAAAVSVLGKRGGGRASPFVFMDGAEPLDYTDFAQVKLPVHTLLYLCADHHYSNKHDTHAADEEAEHSAEQQPASRRDKLSNGANCMDTTDENYSQNSTTHTTLPRTTTDATQQPSVQYDAITAAEQDEQHATLFAHHPFHRFYRSHKAALAAWKQRMSGEGNSGSGTIGRVMEFACREPLHVLHINPQQRAAVFASDSSSSSSTTSSLSASPKPDTHLSTPPPLLSHLLSTHNDCVGYEVEEQEADGVVLTSSACECQLSLLDDDKRTNVSQALLTDMFARLHC